MCKQGLTVTMLVGKSSTPCSIDSCIADIVETLNAAGLITVASCCGHGRGIGSIALKDGRELLIADSFKTARRVTDWFYGDSPHLHNNVPAPTCEGWWWVQNGTLWPVWLIEIDGEWWDISREGPMEKWELHPGERFTGPIPEPGRPKGGE